jgi:ATP-dependent Clp protease ATP-binding subunit ClpC
MPDYSDGLTLVWQIAAMEAGAARHGSIKPAHFFIALCKTYDLPLRKVLGGVSESQLERHLPGLEAETGELRRVFDQVRLDAKWCRRRLRAVLGTEGAQYEGGVIHRDSESRRLFEDAENISSAIAASTLRPVHLLEALCQFEPAPWLPILAELDIRKEDLLRAAQEAGKNPDVGGVATGVEEARREGDSSTPVAEGVGSTPVLDKFGRDLTALAREGKLSPCIGRREEIRRIGQVLLQKSRNNVILVGDPGTGKTCVVEGFARRISGDDVHESFRNKRVVEVSMGALLAGTRYRGDFEERLRRLLQEAAADPNIILFIDEIHTLVGSGRSGGEGVSAGDIFKPALARGEIRCIGATTTREYRQNFEKDPALQRRFQVIWIDEPTRDEAIEILKGVRPSWEEHHGMRITDGAIEAAVDFSMRYATDERLPDKALRLIDEACAGARLGTFSGFETPEEIDREDIARLASVLYKVPLERLTRDEAERLKTMEEALKRRVKGQEEAVGLVSSTIRTARAGLRNPNRPQGIFLFLGPTGTGKTELARALAEYLFDDEKRLVRFDMSEYAERHTISKLIGSPPGYIGHEEEGQLTGPVRNNRHCVVLFDEVEKAHPDVQNLFLQIFDEGRLTDSHGRRVDFAETVIIMTSNLGAAAAVEGRRIGFAPAKETADEGPEASKVKERIIEEMRKNMPPELLGRIQHIVVFNPLTREVVREIIGKFLGELEKQLAPRSITLEVEESAYELLLEKGYEPRYGARPMAQAVERMIAEPLGRMLIDGEISEGSKVVVSAEEGEMKFECGGTGD